MAQHPMVEEVNRLVGNLLAGGGELFLPGVGSLYPERHGAKRLSKRTVEPPCRTIGFTSQQRGVSLVDEIARVIRESEAAAKETSEGMRSADGPSESLQSEVRAQDIYERWLARTREADMLTISGVGVLKHKFFTLDEAFDTRINPQGHGPVRIKYGRRFDWALAVGGMAMIVAAGIGGYEFLTLYADHGTRPRTETAGTAVDVTETVSIGTAGMEDADEAGLPSVETPPAQGAASDARTKDDAAAVRSESDPAGTDSPASVPAAAPTTSPARPGSRPASQPEGQSAQPSGVQAAEQSEAYSPENKALQSAGTAENPASLVSGRRYVVLGVYSTPVNAGRAVREAARKDGALRFGIYRFGEKFMVSPFESDDAEACRQFIRAHADGFPGMWSYTAR